MNLSQKDQLFALVKSLTHSEKIFFIKSLPESAKNEQPDYLILFYVLDKIEEEEYDEDLLKEKLKDRAFLKHLSVVKNYLFNTILKCLKSYHDENSVKNELFDLLQYADILAKKALYKESYRSLQKAEKIAEKYEFFTFSLEIYDRLLRLNYDLLSDKEVNNYSLEIYQKQKVVLSKIAEVAELKHLRNIRNDISFSTKSEVIKQQNQLQLLENPLLKEGYKFKSYNAGIYHYHLRGRILLHCPEIERKQEAYRIIQQSVTFLESDPELLKVHPINYANALNNLVYIYHQVHVTADDYESSLKIITKIAEIKTESQYLKYRIREKVMVNMLGYYLFSKKYAEGVDYIQQIEKELTENEPMYNGPMYIAAIDSFAMIYFLSGEYSKSLKWVNAILSYKNNMRPDIECFTKVLNLLIHYELGNFDHLEYILKPTEKFLIKNHSYETYHKTIVLFIKGVITETSKTALYKKFKTLAEALAILEKKDSDKMLLLLFNLREWADKKTNSLIYFADKK